MHTRHKGGRGSLSRHEKLAQKERLEFRMWLENKYKQILPFIIIDAVKLNFKYCNEQHMADGESEMVFSTSYTRRYHRAMITVYPAAEHLYRHQKEDLLEGMFHELSHMNTSESAEVAERRIVSINELREANENVTELIAQYIIRDVKNQGVWKKLLID